MKNDFEVIPFLFIFSYSLVPVLPIQPRSVNLALETSFLFDPQDIKENATFIHNIQNVIDKLKVALNQNTPVFRQQQNTEQLTKFLTEIGTSIIKFDDTQVKKFFHDLNDILKTQVIKNEAFDEMVEDDRMKTFIKNAIKEYTNADPMKIKVDIAKCVLNDDVNPAVLFFRVLNKFYEDADAANFKKLLRKFNKAKKSKNFAKFLRKALNTAVFQRYKKLNTIMKQLWKDELRKVTNYLTIDSDRVKSDKTIEEGHGNRRFSLSSIAKAESFSESSRESFDASESIEHIIKAESTTQSTAENEIIINKDLQMNVRTDGNVISVL